MRKEGEREKGRKGDKETKGHRDKEIKNLHREIKNLHKETKGHRDKEIKNLHRRTTEEHRVTQRNLIVADSISRS